MVAGTVLIATRWHLPTVSGTKEADPKENPGRIQVIRDSMSLGSGSSNLGDAGFITDL